MKFSSGSLTSFQFRSTHHKPKGDNADDGGDFDDDDVADVDGDDGDDGNIHNNQQ